MVEKVLENGTQNVEFFFFWEYHEKAIIYILCTEYASVLQNGLPVIKWPEIVEDDIEGEARKVGFEDIN